MATEENIKMNGEKLLKKLNAQFLVLLNQDGSRKNDILLSAVLEDISTLKKIIK